LAEQPTERFERGRPPAELEPALRAGLADLGGRLPGLWDGGRLSVEHKKELLRSLIRRTVPSRPQAESTEIRIVWISGAVSTLSVRQPIRRSRDLPDYGTMVENVLGLVAEGYPDAKIARRLTEEGFRARRRREPGGVRHRGTPPPRCGLGLPGAEEPEEAGLELDGTGPRRGVGRKPETDLRAHV
jgi:hypothetical protein